MITTHDKKRQKKKTAFNSVKKVSESVRKCLEKRKVTSRFLDKNAERRRPAFGVGVLTRNAGVRRLNTFEECSEAKLPLSPLHQSESNDA